MYHTHSKLISPELALIYTPYPAEVPTNTEASQSIETKKEPYSTNMYPTRLRLLSNNFYEATCVEPATNAHTCTHNEIYVQKKERTFFKAGFSE